MRNFITALLMTVSFSFAFAGPTKNEMRDMGKAFKKINATIRDASQNQNNAALANEITQLLLAVVDVMPNTISELPSAQQAEAWATYQEMINQSITLAGQLEQAFLNNDSALAKQIFDEMSDLMDQGHDRFEPQE